MHLKQCLGLKPKHGPGPAYGHALGHGQGQGLGLGLGLSLQRQKGEVLNRNSPFLVGAKINLAEI